MVIFAKHFHHITLVPYLLDGKKSSWNPSVNRHCFTFSVPPITQQEEGKSLSGAKGAEGTFRRNATREKLRAESDPGDIQR